MRKHAIARAIAGARWNPRDGLIGSDQGLWLDPSDLSTMFVESGASPGTLTPASLNGFVGRILDKSGRGNHAFAPTDAARPTLSARYNLLTKTERFDDAYWYKNPATATVPVTNATSPIGTSTACKFAEGTTTAFHSVSFTAAASPATSVSTKYKFSVYVKPAGRTWIALELNNPNVTGYTTYFNLSGSGSIGQNPGANTDISIVEFPVGSGWYLCSISRTTLSNQTQIQPSILPKLADGGGAYTGDGTSGIYIWGADLRAANDGVNIPYQRVNTATDYDADPTKFPWRINYASGQSHTVNFPSNLGSDCVIARASPGVSAVIAENQTVNTPLTLNTNHSGLVITSRDISVDEKARLDEYLDKKAIAK